MVGQQRQDLVKLICCRCNIWYNWCTASVISSKMVVQQRQHLVKLICCKHNIWENSGAAKARSSKMGFSNFNELYNWPAANPSYSKITTPPTAVEKFH